MLSSTLVAGEIHNTARAHRARSLAVLIEPLDNLSSPPKPGPRVTSNGESSSYMLLTSHCLYNSFKVPPNDCCLFPMTWDFLGHSS